MLLQLLTISDQLKILFGKHKLPLKTRLDKNTQYQIYHCAKTVDN